MSSQGIREVRAFKAVGSLPLHLEGAPIRVCFRPSLTAYRGTLLSNALQGQAVLAGSFLRKREIVLDQELLDDAKECSRILIHELFHFVWMRLGNAGRHSWTAVLEAELQSRARGELGWSSEWRKQALDLPRNQRAWREYVCESFCDTAAWRYGESGEHDEFTLSRRWRKKREAWFDEQLGTREVRI